MCYNEKYKHLGTQGRTNDTGEGVRDEGYTEMGSAELGWGSQGDGICQCGRKRERKTIRRKFPCGQPRNCLISQTG